MVESAVAHHPLKETSMQSSKHHQRGYSIIELLVVVSLIGALSLVAVPSFMSLMNSNRMSATIRQVASDLRSARGRAVGQGRPTKIALTTGTTARSYSLHDCTTIDSAGKVTCSSTPVWTKTIDPTIHFESTTFTDADLTANTDLDVVFKTDGTLSNPPASPQVVVRSDRKIRFNEADFNLNLAGTLSTTKTSF
jgi:prepilin-type N-terminal cleavage/methylation domain-containing protein